ncbi:MAG: hypothetical protein WBF04_21360 [Candidatus Sulfotelmatobacter sp.]
MNMCGKEVKVEGRIVKIARLDAEKYRFLGDPEAFVGSLRNSGSRVDLFTFIQKLPETSPMHSYPMEWDNFAAIPISTFDHWWTKQIGFKARNKAKQAEKKGVKCREVPFDDALVRGIWEIYNECPVRQGRRFTHYGKDITTVHREEATYLDCSFFIGAFLGEQLIGFVKIVKDESGTQAGLMNIVSMIRHRDKAPTNALVVEAVRACAVRKISYLVYSNFAYGKKQPDSVADFKERNGFLRINVPRYYVPLTPLGRLAFRFGLHHKLADRFPELLVSKLRKLRNAWYNRKFQAATETTPG